MTNWTFFKGLSIGTSTYSPRPLRRHPQGRAFGGGDDAHRPGLSPYKPDSEKGPRNDGRDHASRSGPPGGRNQGEGHRGAPRRCKDDHPAEVEQKGPGRHTGKGQEGDRFPFRGRDAGGPPAGPGEGADVIIE
jgi:hypothetical protein